METILNCSKPVELIGKQKIQACEYRPSIYNFTVIKDDKYLIYNLFTRGMVSLSAEEYKLLSSPIIPDPSNIDPLYSYFIENYYVIPSDMDDQKSYLEMNDLLHLMENDKYIDSYTLLTTTACNARCFYCFEQDFEPVTMTKETALKFVDYVIQNSGGRMVRIHWFGGEPLCNVPVIDLISSELESRGISFSTHMTSNGYAFTPEIVARVKDKWKLKFVQITLDGMEEEHNRRKNYKAATGSPFLRTMENIHMLLKAGVTVSVRINFDPNNVDSVKELIPYLVNEFSGEKQFVCYVAKIFDDCGSWKSGHTSEQMVMLNHLHEEFTQYLIDHRLSRTKPCNNAYKFHYCGANNIHHRTVSPDGKFILCHNLSATEGYGSIDEGITNPELFDRWTGKQNVPTECDHCPLLPECTPFNMCPTVENNCVETKESTLKAQILECYRRYLNMKKM